MAGLSLSLCSSKSEAERVNEANALMAETVEKFTDEELTWWNATLDEAASNEVDEIVKLYESMDANVDVGCDEDSLRPIIMQYICKYWEGSYGQQKPDGLLLAAYRAGLHLTKSSAKKLFSDALTFIGRASYQEEHPNKSGALVLVLIKQMEMLLSVAGWCLASGVISEDKYASIVEKLFSDQHNRLVDLVYCISDVAVTCTVEEDLTDTDNLVFLRCTNLCESEQQLSTTTIEDGKYEEEKEIFETRNGNNEEKAFNTEVDALAFMTSLFCAYTNEEMKGNDDKNDVIDIGLGMIDCETYNHLTILADVECLNNNGMSSFGIDKLKQHQYLGNGQDRGNAGSRDLSFCPMGRKDIHSPSGEEISGLGLGKRVGLESVFLVSKYDREISDLKSMIEIVWKWIISIRVGVSVVSIGKWICQAILVATILSSTKKKISRKLERSGAPLVFLLMMLISPPTPTHRVFTLAKSNGQFIRHERNLNLNGVGVLQESSEDPTTTTDCRQPLIFDWDEDNPYIYERQKEGKKPFTLAPGCEETQRCLFMPDNKIFNIIAGGDAVFPVFENLLSERSPSIEQVLANAKILYDDKSVENIKGIGTYKGPAGIGEYKLVPRFVLDGEVPEVSQFVVSTRSFFTEIEYVLREKWYHLNLTQTVKWHFRHSYYPCSIIRAREDLGYPPESGKAFSDSGKVDGTVESVCEVVIEHCTGEIAQYNSTEECLSYLGSLAHHDPACQDAYGEYSLMGNSFMCKYLHHVMVPLSPNTHCAHVGKGLPDSTGSYKCVATDCQDEAKSKQITGLTKSSSSCDDADLEELAQGIIYALPFCLPSLEMQVCMSNCTQAINTYLGRFAEKGVIDSCDSVEVLGSSRLLSLISVDAHTLFHICKGDALLAAKVASSSHLDGISIPTCSGVNQYLGTDLDCLGWDWDDISQGMYDEWSAKYKHQRVTQSDDIATAECHVFTQLYTQYLNIQYIQILDDAADMMQTDIQIHPNGHPIILSHEQVSMAFENTQSRVGMGSTFGHCAIPGKTPDWMQDKRFSPIGHDTNSTAHKLARKFVLAALQGLSTKPTTPPARQDLFDERGLLDYDELLRSLGEENFRALLGGLSSKSDSFWIGNVIDDIRDLATVSLSWFFPESLHRAQGYVTGVAYVGLRQSLGRKLRDEFTSLREAIESHLVHQFNVSSPNDNGNDYLAYDALIDAISPAPLALVKLAWDIVKFVRQDPCQMLPLWNNSPEKFVVEYSRLHSTVPGFSTHSGSSPMGLRYQIASANRDPEVFLDPLSFNPDRSDLDQVLTWNFVEGKGPSSHARSCPGRSYAVQFAISHAERYFPNNVICANNMKVHNGVELFKDNVDIVDGSKLQVLKTSTGSNTLFLFLHGFPDIPQEFAPIISHLQSKLNADYWMLNGWSTSKCKITEYAEQVASLISESRAIFHYDKVFLVGHDYGGLVGWIVAGMLSKDVLSGFMSFSPSPQVFSKSLSIFPARKVPFYNLMKPLAGSTYLATKDFQFLDDALTNETFWPEYRDEYHHMWDEVGAHDLTCVYRENFEDVGGTLKPVDLDFSEDDIETDVLLISGEDDMFFPRKLYHASIGAMKPQRGQQLSHTEVYNASHHNILHDHSKETAHHIEMFVRSVNRKQISLWSRMIIPPQVHSSYYEEVSSDAITFYVYILTFVVMLTGIIMELTIGPMLVGKLGFSIYLFAQIMAATINFGCFFAANLITLPIYTIGLFKLGYPEVTSHIIGPIRSPEFYYNSKSFRVMSFFSGIAYVVHHTGGTILYMVVSLHEMNPLSLGFLALALAVGFQHLVVFIKYRYKHLHSFLLIGLEIWFQLESYYALTFATTSARVGIGMLLISHYIWFVHGIMKTSLEIFIMNDGSDVKMDDEEDPDLSENDDSKSVVSSVRSLKSSVHKHHSLRLFSSIHSIGNESDSGVVNKDTSTLPDTIDERSPASSISTRRRSLEGSLDKHGSLRLYKSSFHSIDEQGDRRSESESKNEQNDSSKPVTNGSETSPRVRFQNSKTNGAVSRRTMLQSRPSMLVAQKSRLFDSNEVMHLMGFDDES